MKNEKQTSNLNFNVSYFENRKTTYFDVFCLNFSIETKIKSLFLISYFSLSKKRNGTLDARIPNTTGTTLCLQRQIIIYWLSWIKCARTKSVQIRCYSGPHFPTLGLNTERYSSVFSPNTEICWPDYLRIRTLFAQCQKVLN